MADMIQKDVPKLLCAYDGQDQQPSDEPDISKEINTMRLGDVITVAEYVSIRVGEQVPAPDVNTVIVQPANSCKTCHENISETRVIEIPEEIRGLNVFKQYLEQCENTVCKRQLYQKVC